MDSNTQVYIIISRRYIPYTNDAGSDQKMHSIEECEIVNTSTATTGSGVPDISRDKLIKAEIVLEYISKTVIKSRLGNNNYDLVLSQIKDKYKPKIDHIDKELRINERA